MRKALVALCLLVSTPAFAGSVYIRASVLDDQGAVVDALRYTPRTFDSKAECEAFLVDPQGDQRFISGTQTLKDKAAEYNYTVKLECVED